MGQAQQIERGPSRVLGGSAFDLCAVVLVFVAYTTVLLVARDLGLVDALIGGFANTLPIAALAAVARAIIIRRLVDAHMGVQLIGHAALATAFVLLTYWLLTVILGVLGAMSLTEFTVQPFPSRAMAWQMLQNATTYGLIAALSYLQARPRTPAPALIAPGDESERGPALSRYFIRTGEDIHPIDVNAVVSITGADDYAEVATLQGRHLVRLTLSEFEKSLDGDRFIRVHRSRIVNVDRVSRAEPAGGGRMLLHMENGETISTSRAGARLLRGRVL